ELVKSADVFITSKPGTVRKNLRIDVGDLRSQNSSLIYVRGSGTGSRGTDADGSDVQCFWYRSGASMFVKAADANRVPGMPGIAFGEMTAALALVGGIALALLHRERSGAATVVDVSLLGSGLWTQSATVPTALLSGAAFVPSGMKVATSTNPLAGNYQTKDG